MILETMRAFLQQLRQELGFRLIDKVFPEKIKGVEPEPSKVIFSSIFD